MESAAGTLKPVTLELGGNDSRAVAIADPEKIALFGSITMVPVNWKPGRYGLASTLFRNPFVPACAYENSGLGVEFG